MPHLTARTLAWVGAILLLPLAGRAQCTGQWLPGPGLPGTDQVINTIIEWDPDGPGPSPPMLVCAGRFTAIGRTVAPGLARWDGQGWSAFAPGPSGPSGTEILSLLALPTGELVAAGRFPQIGGIAATNIAIWNGAVWRPLAEGISGTANNLFLMPDGSILASASAATVAGRIVRWDGSAWTQLGAGLPPNFYPSAFAVVVGGDLIAAGSNGSVGQRVYRYSGGVWTVMGTELNTGPVNSLAVLNDGTLIAGGDFTTTNGATSVARWERGDWRPVPSVATYSGWVAGLVPLSDGTLLSRGSCWITPPNGVSQLAQLARYVDGNWQALGNLFPVNLALQRKDHTLVAGIGITQQSVVELLPSGWRTLGDQTTRKRLDAFPNGDDLIFDSATHQLLRVGDSSTVLGVFESVSAGCVLRNGDLVVGRLRHDATGAFFYEIALGRTGEWSTIASAFAPTFIPLNGGMFFVSASSISTSADPSTQRMAIWDGAVLHTFVDFSHDYGSSGPTIRSLAGGALVYYVIGARAYIASISPDGIPRTLGNWVNPGQSYVASIVEFTNGEIALSGNLVDLYPTAPNAWIFYQNGAWGPFGPAPGTTGSVIGRLPNGDLLTTFSAYPLSGVADSHMLRWNGRTVSPVGPAFRGTINSMHFLPSGELAFDGSISDPAGIVHSGDFHLAFDDTPSFTSHPQAAALCTGRSVQMSAAIASPSTAALHWEILDGTHPWQSLESAPALVACAGGGVALVSVDHPAQGTTNFTVVGCSRFENLLVRCVATTSCTQVASHSATLHFCRADWNCSGSLSAQDIFDYLSDWFFSTAAADLTGDLAVDVEDLFLYIADWFEGC